jgi:CrcB protein
VGAVETVQPTEGAAPEATQPARWPVLVVVAVGGAIGAVARHGVDVLLPAAERGFPVGTFLVNVVGCLIIGALAGLFYRARTHRLVQPFLGVGILGGFTTFSTYTVQAVSLGLRDEVGTSFGYLLATVLAALVAVEIGLILSRGLAHRRRHAAAR